MNQNLTEDEKQLLDKLPADGTAIGNKTLRSSLGWDQEKYWSIRDSLVDREFLRLGRGKGGSVARIIATGGDAVVVPAADDIAAVPGAGDLAEPDKQCTKEDALYGPLADVLRDKWTKELRLEQCVIQVTARQGRRETGGTWTRPDIVVVSVASYLNLPGKFVEVITFEVKTADGLDVTAVYEALSHLRAATRAYLVVAMTARQRKDMEALVETVADEAGRHGIGFIIVPEDVTKYDEWEFIVESTAAQGVPSRMDDFLERQLTEDNKRTLRKLIK
jgi:hypothetical protein